MKTTTNVTTNTDVQKIAQKYIAEYFEKERAKCQNIYRDDAKNQQLQESLEANAERERYNVMPLIALGFENESDLPPLEVLVALGEDNVRYLILNQRFRFGQLQKRAAELRHCLTQIATQTWSIPEGHVALPEEYCTYDFPNKTGLFNPCCYFCPAHRDYVKKALEITSQESIPQAEETYAKIQALSPNGKPCFMYQSDDSSAKLQERFIKAIEDELKLMGQQKHLTLKYIRRLIAAKHDSRLPKGLPVLPNFRSEEEYLKGAEIFCHLERHESMDEQKIEEYGFQLCRIAPDISDTPNLIAIDSSGELHYADLGNSPKIINSVKLLSGSVYQTFRPNIEYGLPTIIKPWEILALRANREYAKMWAYSNYHPWNAKVNDIKPLLEAIMAIPQHVEQKKQ